MDVTAVLMVLTHWCRYTKFSSFHACNAMTPAPCCLPGKAVDIVLIIFTVLHGIC